MRIVSCATIPLLLLLASCNKSNRTTVNIGPRTAPITEFQLTDWNVGATGGAEQPRTDTN